MSNLRERLKQIQERMPSAPVLVEAEPSCRVRETLHPAHDALSIDHSLLRLLGSGECRQPLFLDTETTGLGGGAGTVAFMVGIGRIEADNLLHVVQLTMTDYDQERDLLLRLTEALHNADTLVTYNGKSFDIPLLRTRFIQNRMSPELLDLPHIDLLHTARRIYKRRLKRCSLSDMEENILGVHRESDLPGALAPEYWFRFLKTGEEALLDEILSHNEQDIASLAYLLTALAEAYSGPEQLSFELDRLSVGKAMEKLGEPARAADFYRAAGHQPEAMLALARIHRRENSLPEAVKALEQAANMGSCAAMIELSKLYEHRLKHLKTALSWADQALAAANAIELAPILKRRARISTKIRRREEI